MEQQFYLGIVEDRKNDPLKLGRVRVRVFGVHSESLDDVPTESLPWAITLMPATSASLSGIGETVAYVEGTLVFLFFQDGASKQQPVILGSAPGIPLGKSPFGSAGIYLTETFDDVTPIEPEINIVNDGSDTSSSENKSNGYIPDYRGIDGNDGDIVFRLTTGRWSNSKYDNDSVPRVMIPDDRFVRWFDKERTSSDGVLYTVSVDGWYESEHTDGTNFWYDTLDNGTIVYGSPSNIVSSGESISKSKTIIKSVLYDNPIENYKGIDGDLKELVVIQQSIEDESKNTPEGIYVRNGVLTKTALSINLVDQNKQEYEYFYVPAYKYYYSSEHVDSNGKYWYDVYSTPMTSVITDSGANTNIVTETQTPKSSGVDITKAIAKYGNIVDTVYKTLLDFGIKNNAAVIAILSNIGKESKFVPKREDMTYKTVKQLRAIFPSKFASLTDTQITPYTNNEVKLANFVYANSDGNGDELSGDGYKYRGGGLIQLTKKSNYQAVGQSLGIDIASDPDLVLGQSVASKVVAQYFINRYGGANRLTFASVDEALTDVTKKVNPGGFTNDYPKVVEESKLYVNNSDLTDDQAAEISNANDPENDIKKDATQEEINSGLISKKSYTTNNLGFKDPSEKYPLESLLKEPDTNRLSRRIINQTSVETKRKNRRTNIKSTGKDTFSEPPAAYNAQYPYNKVLTSESGHVMEFDDTFGCERVNIFHTSGTFIEMDSKGNQVNKIIGDNFSITEKNGYIFINGTARVSIGGDVKLSIGGNLDIDVGGDINYTVKGSINTKVGKDISTNVIGNITELVKGKTTETSGGIKSILSSADVKVDASKLYLNSGSKPATPKVPPATNTTSTIIKYNLPESFVDGEIVKFDDVEESQLQESRTKAIRSGLITQRQIDDGDKIVSDKAKDAAMKKDDKVPTNTPTPLPESCAAFADKTNIPETLQLSKSFNLAMLSTKAVVSHYKVGAQRGLKEHEIVCNLKKVAENCLDPIKVKYPNMFVTSGFRSGSGTSQHELGEAIDMQFTGASKSDYYDIAVWIKNNVIFDKLLLEYKTTGTGQPWIHIAYRTNPRKEIYTFMNNAKVSSDIRKLQ